MIRFSSVAGPLGSSTAHLRNNKNLSKENGKRKIKAIFINRLDSAKAVIN